MESLVPPNCLQKNRQKIRGTTPGLRKLHLPSQPTSYDMALSHIIKGRPLLQGWIPGSTEFLRLTGACLILQIDNLVYGINRFSVAMPATRRENPRIQS